MMRTVKKTHYAIFNDRYLLTRIIGQGNLGIVWLAFDIFPETFSNCCRKVAVKIIDLD
jgi:hypothetical protein